MHTLPFRKLSLVCALAFASACGDDTSTATESSTGATTSATATTGGATMTDATAGTTTDEPTTAPTTMSSEPTTMSSEPTTMSSEPTTMATDPTEDPTAGGGGQFCQESCAADTDCTSMGVDVGFKCVDGYHTSIDMPTALHPQTQMTFKFGDEILPRAYGYPMKIRVPTKLGFKNPKYVISMGVVAPPLPETGTLPRNHMG